ncbi:MAG TPA: T9SS type A sorting domain-containing protein [Chitinophagales bacterium]|nr:T9SS type A sorting domain-containing protein [Chitinophagales bacterium]
MKKGLFTQLLVLICSVIMAGNFTPGNIVILRVGDGSTSLSNASQPVFLDEYTPAGVFVQSFAVPTVTNGANHQLVLSGSASSEGSLTLSADGRYLAFAGYDTTTGFTSVASTDGINRTIGRVDSAGNINTTTGFIVGSAYKKNNIRGAVTNDGASFWCSGTGSSSLGGTFYAPFGSFTSSPVQVSTDVTNTRVVNIAGGQLYISSASGSYHGMSSVGTGLPTTSGQTTASMAGVLGTDTSSSSSMYGFAFFDLDAGVSGNDVVYACDDRTGSTGGIIKYSLVGGNWVYNGNIPCASGLRGITGSAGCGSVQLFLTAGDSIFTFTDNTGYNQTISGTLSGVAAAATNTVFRGIAFAPKTSSLSGVHASVSSSTNVACNGGNTGAINISVSGGSTYTYAWSDGSITTQNRTGLTAGTYTVTVTANGSCTAAVTDTITEPSALSVSATPTSPACHGGATGSINLSVGGGTQAYTYLWSNNATTQNLNNITGGNYSVVVTDAHNCTATYAVTVTEPAAINITASITNLPCASGGNTGAVDITVTGGTPSLGYVWSNSATTEDISGLGAGSYTVTVTDANSCSATFSATISNSGSLTVTPSVTDVLCNGGSTGGIAVTPAGGTAPYAFLWSNTDTSQNLGNVAAGNYTLTVTDNGGCTSINTYTVTEPSAISILTSVTNITCYGVTNGSVSLTVSGGSGAYTYAWPNSVNPQALDAGSYTVTVTDANSCTATVSATVNAPDSLSVNATVTNVTTHGGSDGSVALAVTGGTGVDTYTWGTGATTSAISNITAGAYCVTITDANNCSTSDCYNVSEPTGINNNTITESFNAWVTGGNLEINAVFKNNTACTLQLYNINGQRVANQDYGLLNRLNAQLPVNGLASGCYLLRLVTTNGTEAHKLVITQ